MQDLKSYSEAELLQFVLDILVKKDTTDQDLAELAEINDELASRATFILKFGE